MDNLEKKTIKVGRGYTYTYYLHKPSSATKPALVFCHGWPDNAHLYAGIVPALLNLGHPILLPDMLGYDGTSKPTDFKEYDSKSLADDVYDIIDSEGFNKIIPVGHDWGSWMAQRLYIWRPERCVGIILLNVAYMPPSPDTPFDLETSLDQTEQAFGYPTFAYWDVFAADDGPPILLDNVETLFHLIHWDDPEAMKTVFCQRGQTRKLLQESTPGEHPLKPYAAKPGFKDAFLDRMRRDGFEGPQCWYKAVARNVQFEVEKSIPQENLKIKDPCLFIGCNQDAVCLPQLWGLAQHLVQDGVVEHHMIEANHWGPYEDPKGTRDIIAEWLQKKF